MELIGQGALSKMTVELTDPVQYGMRLDQQVLDVNAWLGKRLRIEFLGAIHCSHCGRKTKKSFNQGYCYPCFTRLAQCDSCIMSPERCHYAAGTCREPAWGEQFCMTEHIVYLANSSGVKVGITRASQVPTRWIDQGASQALPIFRVATRQQSGLVEDLLRSRVGDRTNWRALLKTDAEPVDLPALREQLFASCAAGIEQLQQRFGLQAIQRLGSAQPLAIRYPVQAYPLKINSHDLDKNPVLEGTLLGIKGQYLMFDSAVINIRKYTAYQIAISCKP
jgi:hypothetical protein